MKAILEFELPEDQEEHQLALAAFQYRSALQDIFYRILRRQKIQQ